MWAASPSKKSCVTFMWVVSMEEETKRKLEAVEELLRRGYSLRKAIKEARLGCKSYYKYEDYMLSDKSVPRPRKVLAVNVRGQYRVDKIVVDTLRDLAKHVCKKALIRKYKSIRALKKHRKEYRQLVRDLVDRWLYEILIES